MKNKVQFQNDFSLGEFLKNYGERAMRKCPFSVALARKVKFALKGVQVVTAP